MRTVLIFLFAMPLLWAGPEEARKVLLDGVHTISAPGVPGPFCLFGKDAFAVVTGKVGRDHHACVVAATACGRGRAVLFGHTGYFDGGSLAAGDTAKLVANAIRWSAGKRKGAGSKLRVGIFRLGDLRVLCKEEGLEATLLEGEEWYKKLGAFDVICLPVHHLSAEVEQAAVLKFVRKGGGLITGGLGWGWQQLNSSKKLIPDHPGNRLLAGTGVVWSDGYMARTAEVGFAVQPEWLDKAHGAWALQVVSNLGSGQDQLPEPDLCQAVRVLTHAVRSIPPEDRTLLPRIRDLLKDHAAAAAPSPDQPLREKEHLARMVLTLQLEKLKDQPPEQCEAHPAASFFPGEIPKRTPRVSQRIKVDTSVPGWHSTGLYAPAGKVVKAQVAEEWAGAGLKIRIGAHSDTLWHKKEWKRCPAICKVLPLAEPWTSAACAFGGLIYIEVPEGIRSSHVPVRITQAVEAPRFILGKTDPEQWQKKIRHRPAPWAELESGKVILTLRSEHVRELDDPAAVMTFWDQVLDCCADLAARPRARKRPERYVTDLQISAGYMHAGYPIMTHLDMGAVMVDPACMKREGHGGVWGLFHEMGHNHQSADWTFSGAGEVTCNLFTLYVFDQACGMGIGGHQNLTQESRDKKMGAYLDGGADFNTWKSDPFLALIMYVQLQEAFGWEAFKKVIAGYRAGDASERPRNDLDRRDQWMTRFSRTVEKNLGPFFQAWGVPVSGEALQSIGHLPDWMPDGMER